MMKLVGMISLLIGSSLLGLMLGARYEERIKELQQLQQILYWCEGEISYSRRPLPEIFPTVAARIDGAVAQLPGQIAMLIDTGLSASEAWQQAVAAYLPTSALNKSDGEILLRLGQGLGQKDLAGQCSDFAHVRAQLAVQESQAVQEKADKAKICRYLGFLSGAAAVIVLI